LVGNGGLKMVKLDPAFNSRNADEVLRSIQELLVQQAHAAKPTMQSAGIENCGPGKGTQPSPIVAPPEPSIESSTSASPEPPSDHSQQTARSPARSNPSFVSKRMVQTVVGSRHPADHRDDVKSFHPAISDIHD
jgi:hypothetical protein